MVDEQLRVHAEEPVQQLLVVELAGSPEAAPGDVAHRVQPVFLQFPGSAPADPPEIGERPVIPELFAITLFVELRDAHAVLVRVHVLRADVHRHFAQVQIGPDSRGRRDPGLAVHFLHELLRELARRHAVSFKVGGGVDHHFVDGIDMDVLRRDELQVDVVDPRAVFHVEGHARPRGDEIDLHFAPRSPLAVDFLHALHDFKQAGPPRDPERFQSRRNCEADRLLRAALVRHDKARRQRIQASLPAFHRGVKGF